MDLQAAVTAHSSTELYVTNLEYHEESVGHKGTMPIITARCRDSDGTFHQIEIDGFRPFFAITTEEFWSDPKGVCADRHVHAVEGCFTDPPDDVISSSEFEQVSVAEGYTGSRIADALSELTGTSVVHRETPPAQTLTDEPVVRIYTEVPGDVSDMREHFEQTYEADVPFTRRFATATGVVPGMRVESTDRRLTYQNITTDGSQPIQELDECEAPDVSPRVCIFDIETETPDEGFPDPDRAKQRITAISGYDSYTNEYKLWTLRSPQWKFDGHSLDDVARQAVQETEDRLNITLNEDVNTDADAASRSQSIVFDDEEALIESFHEWYLDRNFDMITGWNSNLFDIPYIIQRSYNRSVTQMYDWYEHSNPGVWKHTRGDDEQLNFSLDGVSTLDMLDAYSKTQYRALDSKRLEDVAQDEVGFGKVDLDVDSYDDAWHNHPIDFLVYNVRDTQAVAEIERTSSLLDLYDNIRSVTTTLYETCNSNGQALDTMFLRFAYRNDIALPTNTAPDENVYHGAKVFETVPGYHPNAVYPDLSSLYPSLFAMLNLGVGTIIGDREALADSEYGEDDVFRFPVDDRPFARLEKGVSYDHLDRDTYKGVKTPDGNLREMFDPAFQWRFVLKPEIKESFIKGTIDELIDMKNQYTGGMYESVKRITNSCFTPDTEVLTSDGIENIRDVDVGDMVYSLNPETNELEQKPVTEVIEKPDYDGELIHIQNSRIDLCMTPDHRVYSNRTRHTDEWESVRAGDLNRTTQYNLPHEWNLHDSGSELTEVSLLEYLDPETVDVLVDPNVHGHTFSTEVPCDVTREPNCRGYIISGEDYMEHRECIRSLTEDIVRLHTGLNRKWIPEMYDGDNFIELCMWFVTEGSIYRSTAKEYESTTRGETTTVNLAQYDQDDGHHTSISDLLDEMGLTYHVNDRNHCVASRALGRVLEKLCGSGSYNKKLPSFLWDVSSEQKEFAFQVLLAGDGDLRDGSYRYSTASDELRDDMIRLCFETGRNGRYSRESDVWRIWYSPGKNSFRMNRVGSKTTADNGVYCVQVADNHMLVAGRNGNFQHIPNCYGIVGDSASAGVGSRMYNRYVAEGITLAGRLTIEHTAREFTEYIQEHYDSEATLIGGDTDSSVTSIPNADSLEQVQTWAQDAVEHVDESYDEFAEEMFWMDPEDDTHRLEVELESVASGLFFIESDDSDVEYVENNDGYLVRVEETTGVQKRYAQHIVWDDDDGWIDTPDADEYPGDALSDSADLSAVKQQQTCTHETYTTGPLSDRDATADISISGFEYVRSDTATITKQVQLRVLTDILLATDTESEIEPYLQDVVDDIRNGEYELSALARPKGVSQPLDEYGWVDLEDAKADEITDRVRANEGLYRQRAGPTYRGAKYANDHIDGENITTGTKPVKIPIETIRDDGSTYPHAYQYESYPTDGRPSPPEVGDPVDAVAVEDTSNLPTDVFIPDYDTMITKSVRDPIESMLETINLDWEDIQSTGTQSGLDQWT